MVLLPLIVALAIVANAFFGNHWERVHATMARTVAGEISTMMQFLNDGNMDALNTMANNLGFEVSVGDTVKTDRQDDNHAIEAGPLSNQLKKRLNQRADIYINRGKRSVKINVPTNNGQTATFAFSMYRIYSTSTEVFLMWLIGAILIVSILVAPFVIMHTRSIRRIARAANRFGRGLDAPGFKPSGSREIREAAAAMITMKERLNRYNRTRTDMLNAVSHDLKSPLARMRLAVETETATKDEMLRDIDRMTEMVNGYLAFARGEMPEIEQATELPAMLIRTARDAAPKKKIITDFPEMPAQLTIKITEHDTADQVEIIIEDDGPGIPDNKKDDALRPFVRLDDARGAKTGGTGLGLSIAKTAIENHGGQIFLENSDLGGLRVRVVLPI